MHIKFLYNPLRHYYELIDSMAIYCLAIWLYFAEDINTVSLERPLHIYCILYSTYIIITVCTVLNLLRDQKVSTALTA